MNMGLDPYLAVLFGLLLSFPTNGLLLPHGHYSCGCFKVSFDEKSYYNLGSYRFRLRRAAFLDDELKKDNKMDMMEDFKKENLIATVDSNCQDNDNHMFKICCTESINYVVGFCCINRENEHNKSSTPPTSSSSTNSSLWWKLSINSVHSRIPKATKVVACSMSKKVEALTVQSFNAWSKHTFQLKYLLVACFIYPMVILSIFILLYFHAKKRFDHPQNNHFARPNGRNLPNETFTPSPPSYNSMDPPPYSPISTIFLPTSMQTPLQSNMEGSHPVLLQETL